MDEVIHSQALGLDLIPEGDLLRLRNSQTGQKLLTPCEAQAARRAEAEARRAPPKLKRPAYAPNWSG